MYRPGDDGLMSHALPNNTLDYAGAVIGAVWGFIDGAIGGFVFAWLYNKLSGTQ